jgi:hypothetical protein
VERKAEISVWKGKELLSREIQKISPIENGTFSTTLPKTAVSGTTILIKSGLYAQWMKME